MSASRKPGISRASGPQTVSRAFAPSRTETKIFWRIDRKAGLVASIPLKREGKPEEIADAILFATSAKASFITGQIIRANGGRTAS